MPSKFPNRKRRKRGSRSTSPARIPIHTLNGGVGRQAPSKRLPNEVQTMDNALVTVERSFEKRPGFELLSDDADQVYLDDDDGSDFWWQWFIINDDNQYVIRVRYEADSTAINGTDQVIKIWKVETDGTWSEETVPTVNTNTLAYIVHGAGSNNAADVLKAVVFGTQVIILNSLVKAGFTSTDDGSGNYYTRELDGDATAVVDLKGQKVTYYTSAGYDTTTPGAYTVDLLDTYSNIPVDDLTANVFALLPQSVVDFSELEFPPSLNDWYAVNWFRDTFESAGTSEDEAARAAIAENHDSDTPFYSTAVEEWLEFNDSGTYGRYRFPGGLGKVFETQAAYLSQPPGYYRIINFEEGNSQDFGGTTSGDPYTDLLYDDPDVGEGSKIAKTVTGTSRPYTQRIRTPDKHSVIDPNLMPQSIKLDAGVWSVEPIAWTPRLAGDTRNNPGPSVFTDPETKAARWVSINAMAVYRSRLWFASGDVIFSSQQGDEGNLWQADPGILVDTDPIDIPASSNKYAEITSMVPFNNFLFVNTKGDTQFELRGSENVITPTTANLSPTTFYSTAPLVDPIQLGSQIYFFAPNRLYIYFAEVVTSINSAVEVSAHAIDYLPATFGDTTVSPSQDTIIAVDGANRNHIYLYTNRFSGDQVIQSSFFRYILDSDDSVVSVKVLDNYLYTVVQRNDGVGLKQWLYRTYLRNEAATIPRIDRRYTFTLGDGTAEYDPDTNFGETTFTIPYRDPDLTEVILGSGFGDQANLVIGNPVVTVVGTTTTITVPGDFSWATWGAQEVWFGTPFTMEVELSTQFVRDEDNNPIDGVLNLKSMVLRHFNTGDYDVEVIRRGRTALVTEFTSLGSELHTIYDEDATAPLIEEEGELVAKILGYSDTTRIKITSDYPTPVNITNIEIKGRFKQTYTSANT